MKNQATKEAIVGAGAVANLPIEREDVEKVVGHKVLQDADAAIKVTDV